MTSPTHAESTPSRRLLAGQAVGAGVALLLALCTTTLANFGWLAVAVAGPAWLLGWRTNAVWFAAATAATAFGHWINDTTARWPLVAAALCGLVHVWGQALLQRRPGGRLDQPRSTVTVTAVWLARCWFALLFCWGRSGLLIAALWAVGWLLLAVEQLRAQRGTPEPWPLLAPLEEPPRWWSQPLWTLLGGLPTGPHWLSAVLRDASERPFGRRLEALHGVLRRSRRNLDAPAAVLHLMVRLWTGRAGSVLAQAPRLRERWAADRAVVDPALVRQLWLLEALAATERGAFERAVSILQALHWLAPPDRNDQLLLSIAEASLELRTGRAAAAAERLKDLPLRCHGALVPQAWARYARLLRAQALLATGDAASAERLACDDAWYEPWSAEGAWIVGQARLARGDRDGAVRAFHESRRLAGCSFWRRRAVRELTALATINAPDSPPDSAGSPAPPPS
ncbi:MAG: hypothetical protein IT204_14530 [Fimbriimonadaceae bacterium]|nr:hypothetical protein [Fimbriimonadaceae bacterium]